MYRITTHNDGTQSIMPVSKTLEMRVIDDEPPLKTELVGDLPNTRLGKVARQAREHRKHRRVDLPGKRPHNDRQRPGEATN